MAAKHGVPVCPHAGGVGLCEMVQHLAVFDYLAISGTLERRMAEYVDHLHERSSTRCGSSAAHTRTRRAGIQHRDAPESLTRHRFPDGVAWRDRSPATAV